MYLLVDLETTGLDPATSRIWEVGMQVVDDNWQYQAGFSVRLMDMEIEAQLIDRKDILPNLPTLNSIKENAQSFDTGMHMLCRFVEQFNIHAVMAYNAKFDGPFLKKEVESSAFSLTRGGHMVTSLPWYCMMEHNPSHQRFKCWKLGHLALDYGIAVDPSKLHGAYEDIDLSRRLSEVSGTTPQEIIRYAEEPWVILRAITEKPWVDGGTSTTVAKGFGFAWEKARGMETPIEKAWVKRVKESKVAEEINAIGDKLPVRIIQE